MTAQGDFQMPAAVEERRGTNPLVWILGCFAVLVCICCMIPTAGVIVGAVLFGVSEENKVTETEDRSLEIDSEIVRLVVDNPVGETIIRGDNEAETVDVEITRRARGLSESRARDRMDEITVDVRREGDDYVIEVDSETSGAFTFVENVDVELLITVPRRVNIVADGDVGSLRIRDVEIIDELDLHSDVGSIEFDGVIGPAGEHTIESNVGSIDVFVREGSAFRWQAEADGAGEVNIDLERGEIEESESDGPSESATGTYTSGGVDEYSATLRLRTDVGSIDLED